MNIQSYFALWSLTHMDDTPFVAHSTSLHTVTHTHSHTLTHRYRHMPECVIRDQNVIMMSLLSLCG